MHDSGFVFCVSALAALPVLVSTFSELRFESLAVLRVSTFSASARVAA